MSTTPNTEPQIKPQEGVTNMIQHVETADDIVTSAATTNIMHEIANLSPEERQKLERKLVRKIDRRLLPMTILMYILNYIDRNNIAAARLQGLESDLNLVGKEYNTVISIYFVGYILMQVPSNLCLSYFRPSIWIPGWMIIWGVISSLTALAQDYKGLIAVRFFLGFAEAPYFAGAMFLFSGWYTRKELSFRVALLFCGILLSGAFGNLLAAGVLAGLKHHNRGIAAWRWLFIIEGAFTIAFAALASFIIPNWPENTKWLSEKERALAVLRLVCPIYNNLAEEAGEDEMQLSPVQSLKMAVKDYKVWLFVFLQILLQALSSLTNWFPSLVKTLGYGTTKTLLLTAPPYIVAAIIGAGNSLWSDHRGVRSTHMIFPLLCATIAFIIPLATLNLGARYFSMFLMLSGVFGGIQVSFTWNANTIARPRAKRAIAIGMSNCISQTSQIWASYMYPATAAPRYTVAWTVNIVVSLLAVVTVIALRLILQRLNKKAELHESPESPDGNGIERGPLSKEMTELPAGEHATTEQGRVTFLYKYLI